MATGGDSPDEFLNGDAVFIVNEEGLPGSEFKQRKCAIMDLDHLQAVFVQALGFKWINADKNHHYNLSLDSWDHTKYNSDENMQNISKCKCILCLIKESCRSESKYFVLAIGTHGGQNKDAIDHIQFSDGRKISTNEILKALDDDNCPALKGKIRIVFVGACRSNYSKPESLEDKGTTYMIDSKSPKGKNTGLINFGNSGDEDKSGDDKLIVTDTLIVPSDFLVVYSTTTGKRSKREKQDHGIWMYHFFDQVVKECKPREQAINFLKILTEANRRMSQRETKVYKRNEEGNKLKDEDGNSILVEDKSGLKSCMCVYHNLSEEVKFYPKSPERPPLAPPKL